MGGTPLRYVATELSKLGGKGMTGHLGSNLSIDFVTALKKNSVWSGKSWVQGRARGLGLESSDVSQL